MKTSAETILETLRQRHHLSIGTVQYLHYESGKLLWRIDASDGDGERWAAEHENYYQAAVLLSERRLFQSALPRGERCPRRNDRLLPGEFQSALPRGERW